MRKNILLLASAGFIMLSGAASAAPVLTEVNADLSASPFTFDYLGSTFTFGATGDIFNPLSVQNSANGAIGSFGGFAGFPVTPTSSFVDRGVVTFGAGDRFASFTSPTTVPFSNGGNFIGLRVTSAGADYFGFAYTVDTTLKGFGFETMAGQSITATTAVPEPATWMMMLLGFAAIGGAIRYRRGQTRIAYA